MAQSFLLYLVLVDEPKFVCLMDREAKQTKMLEFEVEKGLLLGRARRTDRSCLKSPKSPTVLKEKISFFSFSWPCQAVCGSLSSDQGGIHAPYIGSVES